MRDTQGRKLSAVKTRALNASADIALSPPQEIAYQHTVLCQISLPYRNPGDDVHEWQREQGNVSLLIEAGRAKHPRTGEWIKLGLPFGPKPRLILAHLNAEALRQGSPSIEVEDSLTAFVRRIQQRPPTGPEIRVFKDQLARLAELPLSAWPSCVRATLSRSRVTSSRPSICGSTRTIASVCFGHPRSDSARTTTPVYKTMRCHWTNGHLRPWRTTPWLWISTPGLRNGCIGYPPASRSVSRGWL